MPLIRCLDNDHNGLGRYLELRFASGPTGGDTPVPAEGTSGSRLTSHKTNQKR